MSDQTKIVPALCTQCGGQVEVDPSQESATCPFCGTTFIVDRAINNYNIQHATIEHADNVTVDMKGAVDSVLDFAGKQMSEHRKVKQELRMEEKRNEATMMKYFFGIFGIVSILLVILWFIITVFGLWDDEEDTGAQEPQAQVCVKMDAANDYIDSNSNFS